MIRLDKQKLDGRYLQDNLYTVGSLNLITGKGGEGKSVIAMNIAKQLLKAGLVEHVVYLDSDSKGAAAQDLNNYCYDNGLIYVDTTMHLSKDTPTHLDVMKKLLMNDIDPNSVVVIDALANLAVDVSSNKEMMPIMDFLVSVTKYKNLTLIVLHHTRKSDNVSIGATAIITRAEVIHLVKDDGTKYKPDKKFTIVKDNSGRLGLGFQVEFSAEGQEEPNTFSLDVTFTPIQVDPYESMSKLERRNAIKQNYLLKYAIAYTRESKYTVQAASVLKDGIVKSINKISDTVTRTPADELYIGASFISKELPSLIDTHFDVTYEKQEFGRPLKLIKRMDDETFATLSLGELPKIYS